MSTLASLSIYWDLPIFIVVVSIVYSATKFERWDMILREAFRWARNMALFLATIAAVLFVFASPGMLIAWAFLAVILAIDTGLYAYSWMKKST